MYIITFFFLQVNSRVKALKRQLDEAEEEISRERAQKRKTQRELEDWRAFSGGIKHVLHTREDAPVDDGVDKIPLNHGSFDNNLDVVTATLRRIRGGRALRARVENLHGF